MKTNGFLVTWDELATMGAELVNPSNPAPTGNKIVTKSEGLTYYIFQTSPLALYADNQCPPYEAWVIPGATPAPTASPTTAAPTTAAPTTAAPTTAAPTTAAPTEAPTTAAPTTSAPTTAAPTTAAPTTAAPTEAPTTAAPTTAAPTTAAPTTAAPTEAPTTAAPTTAAPTTAAPTAAPTTAAPTTAAPTTAAPTPAPTGTPATINIHLEEWNESPAAFLDANIRVNNTWYYFSGDFSTTAAAGTSDTIQLQLAEDTPSNVWGPYTTGSGNIMVYENSVLISNTSSLYYKNGGSVYLSTPVTYAAGKSYVITGSVNPGLEPQTCQDCNSTYTLSTGSFNYGRYPEIPICTSTLTDGNTVTLLYDAYGRANRLNIYNIEDQLVTSSGWDTDPGSISFTYTSSVSPYYIMAEYQSTTASISDALDFTILCDTSTTGSLLRTGLVVVSASVSCNLNPSLNVAYVYFKGGAAPYVSASLYKDINGNRIWNTDPNNYLYIDSPGSPVDGTYLWLAPVPLTSGSFIAVKDDTGFIIENEPILDCMQLSMDFVISKLSPEATGQLTRYIYVLQNPAINVNSPYTATGSYGDLINMGCVGTNGSTFLGWSTLPDRADAIVSSSAYFSTYLKSSGSVMYAIIDKPVMSASFCYYTSDPLGNANCEACLTPTTLYMNKNTVSSSGFYSASWYSNSALSTNPTTGYYKVSGSLNPVYYINGASKTLIGFCDGTIANCPSP